MMLQWKKYYDLGLCEKLWHRWKIYCPHDEKFWISGFVKMFPFKWIAYIWAKVKTNDKRKWEILKVRNYI